MASFATVCRLSSRLAARQARHDATTLRGYRTSSAYLAAQNFTMPAMSPTMTEGNISSWKVKEGDSFAAGDVLLEIETDKAQMDVEAQDDGVMAKIMHGDGSKQIKVGTRIGVLAAPDDDLSTLEIPSDEAQATTSSKIDSDQPNKEKSSPSQEEAPPTSKSIESKSTKIQDSKREPTKASGKAKAQTKPLLPSVEYLIHKNGLSASDIEKMNPSGPNNRLLKGDVLAYMGSIKSEYPTELSSKLNKLTHLDLSNIKTAAPKPSTASPAKRVSAASPSSAPPSSLSQVAMPISMAAVLEVQSRIHSTLGVHMPLSTFITRATDLANENLPRSRTAQPTADDLFNAVLGLDKVTKRTGVRGNFLPQVQAPPSSLPPHTSSKLLSRSSVAKSDIIDLLTGNKTASLKQRSKSGSARANLVTDSNVFSVSVPKGDEKRAKIFLERVKTVLEVEPGSLVL